jgi:aspartyl-tRNA(Asn)/glutamyl-tRNA(Gln) amidotransferase subunit A
MHPSLPPRLAELSADLGAGRVTAATLVGDCLDRIDDPAGQGSRAFVRVYRDRALAAAGAIDRRRAAGAPLGPLAGIPISIKDLFDVAGEVTLAGSVVRAAEPAAAEDAPIVRRLVEAGAAIVGRTNMTEFAYSGLGLNPHYGTPANPLDPERVPGGSSSGAGVAGPYGFAAASIGTDTGGSVRIPAAFCGVVGFKPTQRRIPRDGAFPLSPSLDTIGALAASTECCALLDAVMAGEAPRPLAERPLRGLRLLVPEGSLLTDGLDAPVALAFAAALDLLSRAGTELVERPAPALARLAGIYRMGGVAAPEAYAVHRTLLARRGAGYDPRVRQRIELAARIPAADYIDALALRAEAIREFDGETRGFDACLCPTVAVVPPRFDALVADEAYFAVNALVLRNTSTFNLLDRPALSLPCHRQGDLPVGLMVVGETLGDRRLLEVGAAIERLLEERNRA